MDSVVHFEIPFEKKKRAADFYKKTFGWETNDVPGMDYTIAYTTQTDMKTRMIKKPGAINGGMMKRNDKIKSPIITIVVKNIDEAIKKTKENGGSIYIDKMEIGKGIGFSAYIKDTEGNVIGLWQPVKK